MSVILLNSGIGVTADNTAYTLRLRLALRDIAPFGRNVVYAGNVSRNKLQGLTL